MYVKRHAVVRDGKRYVYLRLVEAYRDESGRVRHRVLRTLGREDELKASGQLEQLAASFARLDPPPAGTRRHVGPLLLVRHYVDRLGLVGLVDDAVPMRGRAMLTHGEVIAALVANRLCGPAPLYDVTGWASSAAMAELFGVPAGLLNDDRLGRALEALAPVAERVRGELALAAASRCGADLSRLHLDLTAVRFTGGYQGSALVAKGGPPTAPLPGRSRPCRHPPAPGSRSTTAGIRAHPTRRPAWAPRWTASASWPRPGSSVSPTPGSATWAGCAPPMPPGCGSWCRCAPTPAGPSGSPPTSTAASTRWPHSTTAPNANDGCPPISAPCGRACWASERSSTTTPAPPTGCASPTSGPPKKPPPSPTPATAP